MGQLSGQYTTGVLPFREHAHLLSGQVSYQNIDNVSDREGVGVGGGGDEPVLVGQLSGQYTTGVLPFREHAHLLSGQVHHQKDFVNFCMSDKS